MNKKEEHFILASKFSICRREKQKKPHTHTKAHTYRLYTSAAAPPYRICWESCRPWRRAAERWHTWGWIWGKSEPHWLLRSSLARSYGLRSQCPKKHKWNNFSEQTGESARKLLRISLESHEIPQRTATGQRLHECHFVSYLINKYTSDIKNMMNKRRNKYINEYFRCKIIQEINYAALKILFYFSN